MPNDLTAQPWKIDTASGTVLSTDQLHIEAFKVVGPAAMAGDAVDVQDQNGRTIWKTSATGGNFEDEFRVGMLFRSSGLKVPTLAGTLTLFIYLR